VALTPEENRSPDVIQSTRAIALATFVPQVSSTRLYL